MILNETHRCDSCSQFSLNRLGQTDRTVRNRTPTTNNSIGKCKKKEKRRTDLLFILLNFRPASDENQKWNKTMRDTSKSHTDSICTDQNGCDRWYFRSCSTNCNQFLWHTHNTITKTRFFAVAVVVGCCCWQGYISGGLGFDGALRQEYLRGPLLIPARPRIAEILPYTGGPCGAP